MLCNSKDGNPRHIVKKIEALSIPVFVIDPRTMSEIMVTIKRIAYTIVATIFVIVPALGCQSEPPQTPADIEQKATTSPVTVEPGIAEDATGGADQEPEEGNSDTK